MAEPPNQRPERSFGDSVAWRGAARRAARLQVAQLVVVIMFGLIAVGTTVGVTRNISEHRLVQRADQETLGTLVTLRDRLQIEYIRYWRSRAEGGGGLTRESRLFAVAGPALVREVAARDAREHSEGQAIRDEVTALADRLAALVQATPDQQNLQSREYRVFVSQAETALYDLIAGSNTWIAQKQADVARATRQAEDVSRVWTVALLGLLALMTATTTAFWWRLGRARSRLVHALESAAHRLAWRAETDQLTGLTGHATFQERLTAQVDAARRNGEALSLVLLDLDHFKEINDTLGHQVGDDILREVGRQLFEAAGPDDLVARVGGEEFAWLLPRQGVEAAVDAADRLRLAIEARPIMGARVTLSAGVCDLGPSGSAAELYRLTDGALYWAKAHGRNVTFRYTPDVVEELSASERADRLERLMAVNTVRALARAVDAKDPTTQRHSERVGEVARALALELGWARLDAHRLYEAALVHDVGKIGVPDAILFKPEPLTWDERTQIQTHSLLGAQIVSGILSDEQVAWVRGHHERIDGTGYPDGLTGDEISEGARILALADAWDAMRSARPYSDALPVQEALGRCIESRDTQFWGPAVDALERMIGMERLPEGDQATVPSTLELV